jgi:hypothetical protein
MSERKPYWPFFLTDCDLCFCSHSADVMPITKIHFVGKSARRPVDNGIPCFLVRDHNELALAYVYFEDEPGRREPHSQPSEPIGSPNAVPSRHVLPADLPKAVRQLDQELDQLRWPEARPLVFSPLENFTLASAGDTILDITAR